MDKQLVIIIGHSAASNYGLVRALAKHNCRCVVISRKNANERPESVSKYVENCHLLDVKNEENVLLFLEKTYSTVSPKPIFISTGDKGARFLEEHYERLSRYFLLPKLDRSVATVEKMMNKSFQKELASKSGFNVLKSYTLDVSNDNYIVPEDIQYPCFVKGARSINTPKKYSKKCNSKEILANHLKKIAREYPSEVMIEQFANIDKECGIMAFCNGQDIYIPALTEFTNITRGGKPGVSITGKSFPLDRNSDLYKTALGFFQSLNMRGLCNIDLFVIGDKYYFSEINIRYAAYCFSLVEVGINLPAICVDAFRGLLLPKSTTIKHEITYFSDCMACEEILYGTLPIKEAKRLGNLADVRIMWDENDPEPYHYYKKLFIKKYTRRLFLKPILFIKNKLYGKK